MNYRREIDGLRALAVLPVILFHAGFETFSGGFVGVDVFFVISGYLITTIILAELEQGKFSIANFYERRARRILPALFFVMFVSIPVAWLWLTPSDMKDFAQSLVSVSLFSSNILFWLESGYFDTSTELKPLLHTWSLAVEEQYYVVFPIVLMLAWRLGKSWILILLGVVALLSFYGANWAANTNPSAAFYLLPTRGWELLIGAFAAFYLNRPDRHVFSRELSEVCGTVGLLLIAYSIIFFDDQTPFPGVYALVPTVGAVLIILFVSQSTLIGKFIGNKVFVGIGLVSFSAYLWHQPLFAFARHRSLYEPSAVMFSALGVTALLLAYLSWKYVETPFRVKAFCSRKKVFFLSVVCSVFFIVFGLIGHITDGAFNSNYKIEEVAKLDLRLKINHGLNRECEGQYNDSNMCSTSNEPEMLVWGDSYAMHLVQGLLASKPDLNLVQKTKSVCGPFLDIAPINAKYVKTWAEDCLRFNDQVFEYIENTSSIKYVVMSSPFGQYVGENANVMTREGDVVLGTEVAYDAMVSTIERIKGLGKIPVVFSPTPQNGGDVGRCLVKATLFSDSHTKCNVSLSDSYVRQGAVYDFLQDVEKISSVIWLNDGLCANGVCSAYFDGIFVYRDMGHLSLEGSAFLGKKMDFYHRIKASVLTDETCSADGSCM